MANQSNNRWILGVITTDVEEKYVNVKGEERKIARFSIAVEGKTGSFYLGVTAWGEAADVALLCKRKGTPVHVYGEVSSEEYNGKTYYKLNCNNIIVPSNILFAAISSGNAASQPSQHQQQKQNGYQPQPHNPFEEDNSDIPF